MRTIMALFIKYKFFGFILFVAFLSVWPLFHAGLIPTHDGEYHLIRFFEFDKMIRSGNWYPRWAPDLDFSYGLPLFTFVYPLPNYVASLLHLFGASFLDSVKLVMVVATFVGAIGMYLWAKEFWGKLGGVVGTAVYLFAPYRFVDIYVRGSVGEVMAIGIFPIFLWAYTKFVATRKPIYFALASSFLALTIFSHNILGLMFFAFTLAYCAFLIFQSKEKSYIIHNTLYIILLGLGLSAIFWLPALMETQFVAGLQIYNIAQNFPDLFQLLFPSWGSGFFDNNLTNQMSVQIGIVNLLIVFLSFFVFLRSKDKTVRLLFGFFLVLFLVLFLLMLQFTIPLWEHIPLIHYFQFPWRLLSLVILVCAFLAGGVVQRIKPKLTALILFILLIATTYSYTQPAYYMVRSDAYYTTRSNFIDSTNSPGNSFNTIWNITRTQRPKNLFVKNENIMVTNIQKKSPIDFSATIDAKENTVETVAISYFPNWNVFANGKNIKTFPVNGLLSFSLIPGTHQYTIVFLQTPLENIATGISFVSFFFLLFILLKKNHKAVQ